MARTGKNPTNGPRALVLDGDAASLRTVLRALESESFSVVAASDGTSGVELLLEELLSLDAVIVAADLPRRDARAFAELVRGAGGERDLAIVVVAGDCTPELRAELLALDVDAVVERSAGPQAVAAATDGAIAARRARTVELELEDPPARPPRSEPARPTFGFAFTAGWSLLPA